MAWDPVRGFRNCSEEDNIKYSYGFVDGNIPKAEPSTVYADPNVETNSGTPTSAESGGATEDPGGSSSGATAETETSSDTQTATEDSGSTDTESGSSSSTTDSSSGGSGATSDPATSEEDSDTTATETATAVGNAVGSGAVAATQALGVIASKMNVAGTCIKDIANGIARDPIYTTYLYFRINSLTISTTSRDPSSNILLSFNNEKTGTGQANKFTITIAYAPNLNEGWDIHKIENALLTAVSADGQAFSSRYCQLQYGYSYLNGVSEGSKLSPVYTGLVMDYSCEIQGSMLMYTITGYSSISNWKESKKVLEVQLNADNKGQPTLIAEQLVNKYLGKTGQSEGTLLASKPYDLEWDTLPDGGEIKGSDAEVEMAAPMDKNVAQALTDVLNQAIHKDQKAMLESGDNLAESKLITYEWFVSDATSSQSSDTAGTIYMVVNKPEASPQPHAGIVFNWMNPSKSDPLSNIIFNFKPEFQGQVMLALTAKALNPKGADGEATDGSDLATGMFIDNSGVMHTVPAGNAPPIGGEKDKVLSTIQQARTSWLKEAQYPYKASMTTIGIPSEIPITGKIKIVPMIYGQAHHSQGVYEVLKITDTINNGGTFITNWELIKVTSDQSGTDSAQT